MSDGPSIREMFINLTGAALDTYNLQKARGVIFADHATFEKRIDICSGCEYITSTLGMNRCKLCGCGLMIKTRLAVSSCPIQKWTRMTDAEIEAMKKSVS